MNEYGMHVILTGNQIDGLEIYGPFKTGDDAATFANNDPHMPEEWWIAPLRAVEELEEGKSASY